MITFDGPILRDAIDDLYSGSIKELLNAWHERFGDENKVLSPPGEATIYRWKNGETTPRYVEQVLAFGSLLDLDPIGLFSLPDDPDLLRGIFQSIAEDFIRGQFRQGSLSFLLDALRTHQGWPPPEVAGRYFKREWCNQDFIHDPSIIKGVYANVSMTHANGLHHGPLVYYFAYRRTFVSLRAWIPYGVVIRKKNSAILFHVHGHTQIEHGLTARSPTIAATHFGSGEVEFRVTSLHEFSLDVDSRSPKRAELYFPA